MRSVFLFVLFYNLEKLAVSMRVLWCLTEILAIFPMFYFSPKNGDPLFVRLKTEICKHLQLAIMDILWNSQGDI